MATEMESLHAKLEEKDKEIKSLRRRKRAVEKEMCELKEKAKVGDQLAREGSTNDGGLSQEDDEMHNLHVTISDEIFTLQQDNDKLKAENEDLVKKSIVKEDMTKNILNNARAKIQKLQNEMKSFDEDLERSQTENSGGDEEPESRMEPVLSEVKYEKMEGEIFRLKKELEKLVKQVEQLQKELKAAQIEGGCRQQSVPVAAGSVRQQEHKKPHRIEDEQRISLDSNSSKNTETVQVTGPETMIAPIDNFDSSGLRPILLDNVKKCNYKTLSQIQKHGIPIVMSGRDMMASGSAESFILPIIHQLLESNSEASVCTTPQCVVITATAEHAIRIHNEARRFTRGSLLKSVVIYGGASGQYQAIQVQKGCNILVATPARLINFLDEGRVSLSNCKYLVLEEAHCLSQCSLMIEVEKIIKDYNMPKKGFGSRQTLVFSKKLPDLVQVEFSQFLEDYMFVTYAYVEMLARETRDFPDVQHTFHKLTEYKKLAKLDELMEDHPRTERTLIFVQDKMKADFIDSFLSRVVGVPATSIHEERLPREREEAMFDFCSGDKTILVATAVASCGLDFDGVDHVINYDMPYDVDEYMYRIGRTRQLGRATSFFDAEFDRSVADDLVEKLTKLKVEVPGFLKEAGVGCGEELFDSDDGSMDPWIHGSMDPWMGGLGLEGS